MAVDVDTKNKPEVLFKALSEASSPSVLLSTINPQVIKLLLYAQGFYPDQYSQFVNSLDASNIPWSFENDAFVREANAFASRFSRFLSTRNIKEAQVNQSVPNEIIDPLIEELKRLPQLNTDARRAFIHKLTTHMVEELKKHNVVIDNVQNFETIVQKAVSDTLVKGLPSDAMSQEIQVRVQRAVFLSQKQHPREDVEILVTSKILPPIIEPVLPRLRSVAQVKKNEEAFVRAIFTEPVANKSYFARALTAIATSEPEEDTQKIIERARQYTQIGESLTFALPYDVAKPGAEPKPHIPLQFFSAGAQGFQKTFARAGDAILSSLPIQIRETVMRSFSTRWLEQATQKLGATIVDQDIYKQAIASTMRSFGVKQLGSGALRSIFMDFGSSVLGNQSNFYQSYLRAGAFDARMPKNLRFFHRELGPTAFYRTQDGSLWPTDLKQISTQFTGTIYTRFTLYHFPVAVFQTQNTDDRTHSFGFLSSIQQWVIGKAKTKAVSTAAKSAAGVAVKKGLGALLAKFLTKIGLNVAADALLAIFTAGIGNIAKWVIQAAVWAGGTILKPVFSFLGKAFRGDLIPSVGALKEFASGLFGGVQAKKQWYESEWFLILALVLLIFFLPMIGASSLMTTQNSTLATAVGGVGEISEELPPYTGDSPPPAELTGCPVNAGHISQCPYGSFSHEHTKAFDIAGNNEAPVYATHVGYVADYRDGLPRNTGTGYGNYVRLAGTTSSGQRFYTIYGHLLFVSDEVKQHKAAGQLVPAGMYLGRVDSTGFSTGPHLHYEYVGPGENTLPIGCAGYTQNSCRR